MLAQLPPGRWVAVDEFFRVLLAVGERFDVARDEWKLYITDQYYGSFQYGGDIVEYFARYRRKLKMRDDIHRTSGLNAGDAKLLAAGVK